MNVDVNAVWQSLRGAAEAGCLPSANMNSEGTRKQVPPRYVIRISSFRAPSSPRHAGAPLTEGRPGDGTNATFPLASGQMLQSRSPL